MEVRNGTAGVAAAVLGALALVLGVVTVVTANTNRGLQQTLAANQDKLAKAQAAATLDNNLVQLLAKSAVDNKDGALRELLRANGVTLKQDAAAPKPEATDNGK
ncbi:MAG: hypothetical protein JSR79_08675 [Proteobacteria bacterium]|nr:hypothetical protein [Pseudomonadota bacterium]